MLFGNVIFLIRMIVLAAGPAVLLLFCVTSCCKLKHPFQCIYVGGNPPDLLKKINWDILKQLGRTVTNEPVNF
jgi:hypothetical protein